MLAEEEQQVELALCELRLLVVHRHATGGRIDLEAVELQERLVHGRGVHSPEHRVHAGHQLGGREGLDHVIVGAEPQADDAVGLLALCGEQDDRGAVAPAVPYAAHQL